MGTVLRPTARRILFLITCLLTVFWFLSAVVSSICASFSSVCFSFIFSVATFVCALASCFWRLSLSFILADLASLCLVEASWYLLAVGSVLLFDHWYSAFLHPHKASGCPMNSSHDGYPRKLCNMQQCLPPKVLLPQLQRTALCLTVVGWQLRKTLIERREEKIVKENKAYCSCQLCEKGDEM